MLLCFPRFLPCRKHVRQRRQLNQRFFVHGQEAYARPVLSKKLCRNASDFGMPRDFFILGIFNIDPYRFWPKQDKRRRRDYLTSLALLPCAYPECTMSIQRVTASSWYHSCEQQRAPQKKRHAAQSQHSWYAWLGAVRLDTTCVKT